MWIFSIGRVGVLVEASLHIRIWANVQTGASSEAPMCVSHLTIPVRAHGCTTVLACLELLIKLTFALSQTQARPGYPPSLCIRGKQLVIDKLF